MELLDLERKHLAFQRALDLQLADADDDLLCLQHAAREVARREHKRVVPAELAVGQPERGLVERDDHLVERDLDLAGDLHTDPVHVHVDGVDAGVELALKQLRRHKVDLFCETSQHAVELVFLKRLVFGNELQVGAQQYRQNVAVVPAELLQVLDQDLEHAQCDELPIRVLELKSRWIQRIWLRTNEASVVAESRNMTVCCLKKYALSLNLELKSMTMLFSANGNWSTVASSSPSGIFILFTLTNIRSKQSNASSNWPRSMYKFASLLRLESESLDWKYVSRYPNASVRPALMEPNNAVQFSFLSAGDGYDDLILKMVSNGSSS
ncbi:hypothetical protein OGAPHI_003288 [Ogataea philodendri]|uniref:Uncharacterized protein n=1 Tax=Ogataea philodendri TaxID=1378263 RepID=A0A9P8P8X5_9ASCO|nr:uncharacterized protein OGAPHI_003288 [Ogataea philodendri]KAH3666839.1 hypothetical protein OGAPHI_003288 [Ogataea philodendri]